MKTLTLGWLYPELMSTYGDRGNILVLKKLAKHNNIEIEVRRINQDSPETILSGCDLLFMGGAQDIQQEIVNKDLITKKGETLSRMIEDNIPALFICGAYQFLGNYYKDAYGTKIQGLGVFDMYTESGESGDRLIGNIVVKPTFIPGLPHDIPYLVGFENHGGRTYLINPTQAFAKVAVGFGNNGTDESEGIHYKNAIGTYLHGPILPSNPEVASYLLSLAVERKYKEKITIKNLNDLSLKARKQMLRRLKFSY